MSERLLVVGNSLLFRGKDYRCAIGKSGFSEHKKEGDGCTPLGMFPLRECWYRADRMSVPKTKLPLRKIHPDDGWCDDATSKDYNRHITIPSPSGRGQGEGFYVYTKTEIIERARDLRKNSTSPEQVLWSILRNRQLNHYKFRRQHPIIPYVADFYCDELKLVIEVDGDSHATEIGLSKDKTRTAYLKNLGYQIIRFNNDDIMQNLDGVYEALTLTLSHRERELMPSHEKLWHDDHFYDLIIPMGYNDAPVIPGKGSAIFLHVTHEDYKPTEGCIALAKDDLLQLLPHLDTNSVIEIRKT